MEIERKWLLKTLPMKEPTSKYWIDQFYLSLQPEVRLRRCVPNGDYENKVPYRLTVKGEGSISRAEIETAISEQFYNEALDFANVTPINKHFVTYEEGGHTIEASVILKPGFVVAEVEFASVTDAMKYVFPWPELVEKEVTEDSSYKMKNVFKKINNM